MQIHYFIRGEKKSIFQIIDVYNTIQVKNGQKKCLR